jgi:hypothetical protein
MLPSTTPHRQADSNHDDPFARKASTLGNLTHSRFVAGLAGEDYDSNGPFCCPMVLLREVVMRTRLLCLAFCGWLLASPAAAIVIVQEGDVYDELEVIDPEFLMTGGSVNQLVLGGITNAIIEGGVIGAENDEEAIVMLGSDHITIRGGRVLRGQTGFAGIIISEQGNPVLTFEGPYFRMRDSGRPEENQWYIEGWLADGSFTSISYGHALQAGAARVEFNITPSELPPGDTNGDWEVDINDLNTIRNNFGSEGPGDLDESGSVDIADLNEVRNHFAYGSDFILDPSMAVPRDGFVPEPSSFALLALASGLAIARRLTS